MQDSAKGLVHVYTGDGKGKTTVSLGIALRAMGWGGRVCMVQFIKGYSEIGEAKFAARHPEQMILKQFAIDPSRHIDKQKVEEREKAAREALEYALEIVNGGKYDVVILDEINGAMHYGLVDKNNVIDILTHRPLHVEIVLTGRNAPQEIIDIADYVTELKMIKHPYEQGIPARKKIDF